jgi:hypothetical protein
MGDDPQERTFRLGERRSDAASTEHGLELAHLRCHLIVPKGARFIRALGYRSRFLDLGIMELTEVELPLSDHQIMQDVLSMARGEMQQPLVR